MLQLICVLFISLQITTIYGASDHILQSFHWWQCYSADKGENKSIPRGNTDCGICILPVCVWSFSLGILVSFHNWKIFMLGSLTFLNGDGLSNTYFNMLSPVIERYSFWSGFTLILIPEFLRPWIAIGKLENE